MTPVPRDTGRRVEGVRTPVHGRNQGHLRVLRGRLRHGPAAAVSALVVLSASAVITQLLARTGRPDTLWARTLGLTDPVLTVTAGLACLQGGADARSRTAWLRSTAPREPLRVDALAFAPSVLWPLAGLAPVLLTVLYVAPAPAPPEPPAHVTPLVLGTTVVAYACLGHLVGRVLPVRVTPLLLTVGLLLVSLSGGVVLACPAHEPCEPRYDSLLMPHAELVATVAPRLRPWCFGGLNVAVAAACVLLCARRLFPALLVVTVPVVLLAPPLTPLPFLF